MVELNKDNQLVIIRKYMNSIGMLLDIGLHIIPMRNNQVMFTSFQGQYNDNPKYISQKLHDTDPSIKQIWAISDRCHERDYIPDYVKVVRYGSVEYLKEKNCSRVLVDNGAGWYLVSNDSWLYRLLKRKNQFNISTWHGTPLKKIGADNIGSSEWNKGKLFTTSDQLISGCSYTTKALESAFLNRIPVEDTGTPRNDILFSLDSNKNHTLRRKLKLPLDKKIVLFAPTYRDNPIDSGVEQMQRIDLDTLLLKLSKKFGGEWVFVFRAHNMVLEYLSGQAGKYDGVISGNEFDDFAEYLATCDAIITDYSGALFDVLLTDKPCFLFAHDKEKYVSEERGVYTNIVELPFYFNESFDELTAEIDSYDKSLCEKKKKNYLQTIGNVEDGKASERIVKMILSFIQDHNNF